MSSYADYESTLSILSSSIYVHSFALKMHYVFLPRTTASHGSVSYRILGNQPRNVPPLLEST